MTYKLRVVFLIISVITIIAIISITLIIPTIIDSTAKLTKKEHGIRSTVDKLHTPGHIRNCSKLCPNLGNTLQVIIIITSHPSHFEKRSLIRKTWGLHSIRQEVAIAFIIGTVDISSWNNKLEKEVKQYNDIIQGNFLDTYYNLTLKTLSIMEWTKTYCKQAKFLLKTDDDMFINVTRLVDYSLLHNVTERTIYGSVAVREEPFRDETSKYFISKDEYKEKFYPNFARGPSYLLPVMLVGEIYDAALKEMFFKLEDVFFTGIVASKLDIKRVNVKGFNRPYWIWSRQIISIHDVDKRQFLKLWKFVPGDHFLYALFQLN